MVLLQQRFELALQLLATRALLLQPQRVLWIALGGCRHTKALFLCESLLVGLDGLFLRLQPLLEDVKSAVAALQCLFEFLHAAAGTFKFFSLEDLRDEVTE